MKKPYNLKKFSQSEPKTHFLPCLTSNDGKGIFQFSVAETPINRCLRDHLTKNFPMTRFISYRYFPGTALRGEIWRLGIFRVA